MKRVLLSLLILTHGVQIIHAMPEALQRLRRRLSDPTVSTLTEEDIQTLEMEEAPGPLKRYARLIASSPVQEVEVLPLLDDCNRLAAAVATEEEIADEAEQDKTLREWVEPAQGLSRIAAHRLIASAPQLGMQLRETARGVSRSVDSLRTQYRFRQFRDEALEPTVQSFLESDDAAAQLVGETRREMGWAAGAMATVSGLAVFSGRFHRSMRQARDAGQMVQEGSKFFGLETAAIAGSLSAAGTAAAAFLKPAAIVALGGYIMLKIRWAFTAEDKMKRMGLERDFEKKLRKTQEQIDALSKKIKEIDREAQGREEKIQKKLQDALARHEEQMRHDGQQIRANAVEAVALATRLDTAVRHALQEVSDERDEQKREFAAALLVVNRCAERQHLAEETQRAIQGLLQQVATRLGINHQGLMARLLRRGRARSEAGLPVGAQIGDITVLEEQATPIGLSAVGIGPDGPREP
ncbi:hypothetical protein JW872_03250 [Candidatus Babeliales bacterium]|nr:hypothetical protein [Candidatus Babeliales bacterium]